MTSLNLLPPEKKKICSKHLIVSYVYFIISWALIAFCIFSILLLFVKLIIQNRFNATIEQSAFLTTEYGELNNQIFAVNKKIDFLDKLQNDFVIWSPNLEKLFNSTPIGIELSSININYTSKDIKISGYAQTRDALLQFKENLKNSDVLKSVDLALKDLLKSTNIQFTINAKLL